MWDLGIEPIEITEKKKVKKSETHFDLLYFDLNINGVESEDNNDFWNSFEDNLQYIDADTINLFFGKETDDLNEIAECCENAYLEIRRCFVDWIKSISIEESTTKYNFKNSIFINFNYTETLQKRFNVDDNCVVHIHGTVTDEQSIIFGHGNRMSDPCDITMDMVPLLSGRFLGGYIVEEIKYRFWKQPLRQWNLLMDRLKSKTAKISDVKNIYILGHSLSRVDMYYFKKIRAAVSEDAVWHITYYSQEDKTRAEKFVNRLKILNYKLYETIDDAIALFLG